MKFRDFRYLDSKTLERYVSVIENGIVRAVESKSTTEKGGWEFDVSLGELQKILIGVGIMTPNVGMKKLGKRSLISVNVNRETTVDMQFDKFFNYIEPAMQYLEGFDAAIWKQLEEGQFVYFSSEVVLPRGYENATDIGVAVDFYINYKSWFGEDEEFEKELPGAENYRNIASAQKATNVTLKPLGSPNFKKYYFVTKIIHEYLFDSTLEELSFGKHYVLGKVDHILKSGEKYSLFDETLLGGERFYNRDDLRKTKDNPFEYAHEPAIIIKPLAIFKE